MQADHTGLRLSPRDLPLECNLACTPETQRGDLLAINTSSLSCWFFADLSGYRDDLIGWHRWTMPSRLRLVGSASAPATSEVAVATT